MAEFIDPAIVPKVTLSSGEEVPCMGMGTFGSDRVSAEDVSAAVAGAPNIAVNGFCNVFHFKKHQDSPLLKISLRS